MKHSSHCIWSMQGLKEIYAKSLECNAHYIFLLPPPSQVIERSGGNSYSHTRQHCKDSKERFLHFCFWIFLPGRYANQGARQNIADRQLSDLLWTLTWPESVGKATGVYSSGAQVNLQVLFSPLLLSSYSFHQNLSVLSATQMPANADLTPNPQGKS